MALKRQTKLEDSAWKDILEELFPQFMEFFFYDLYKEIDFTKEPVFLDKELEKIMKTGETGKRFADKLVKIYFKDGTERWCLCHVEVQGKKEKKFSERIYTYNYRIFDRYHKEVVSLVILTDKDKRFRPGPYEFKAGLFRLIFDYPVVKLIDYKNRLDELKNNDNPFAIVVKTYIRLLEVKKDNDKKLSLKIVLSKSIFNRKDSLKLLRFIDWLINLPEEYEKIYYEEMSKFEEVSGMPYVTTFERYGYSKGLKEGM
ncbi:MAG TPA: cytosolic protein, partial [Candidatus Eremiobacteraeota bacterium]|nr:cytosolic protein [Candidatus Eremiobacteraeota bacterium]